MYSIALRIFLQLPLGPALDIKVKYGIFISNKYSNRQMCIIFTTKQGGKYDSI